MFRKKLVLDFVLDCKKDYNCQERLGLKTKEIFTIKCGNDIARLLMESKEFVAFLHTTYISKQN